jgi:hypothetical protein
MPVQSLITDDKNRAPFHGGIDHRSTGADREVVMVLGEGRFTIEWTKLLSSLLLLFRRKVDKCIQRCSCIFATVSPPAFLDVMRTESKSPELSVIRRS